MGAPVLINGRWYNTRDAPTIEEAKVQFEQAWRGWLDWAKLTETP